MDNKNIQELERRTAGIQVDFDYYSNGFNFTSVEPKSANHLFGNGKWKKAVIDALGETVFNNYCDKFGNKPIDFKVACLKTPQAPYFAYNETITVTDVNNNYTGTFKVIGLENDGVCIMLPFTNNSKGSIINQSRKQGAEKSLKKHIEMLNDLKPKPTIKPTKQMSNFEENKVEQEESSSLIKDMMSEGGITKSFWTDPKKKNKRIALVVSLVLLTAGIVIAYKKFKKK